jgi:hypothetical protein
LHPHWEEGRAEKIKNGRVCMMVELIDDFVAQYPATLGNLDKVDSGEANEVIDTKAKTVAELMSRQDNAIRQQLLEQLMRAVMNYDAEFRRENATSDRRSRAALATSKTIGIADPPDTLDRRGGRLPNKKDPLGIS